MFSKRCEDLAHRLAPGLKKSVLRAIGLVPRPFFYALCAIEALRPPLSRVMSLRGMTVPYHNDLPLARPVEIIPGLSRGDDKAMLRRVVLLEPFLKQEGGKTGMEILAGAPPSGRKIALFAMSDPDGLVDPYIIHHLEALAGLGWANVLIADGRVENAAALPCAAVLARRTPGYDFSSWKGALELFPELLRAEELLLTNDSIFAPVSDMGPVHEAMRNVPCDFWGLAESHERLPHLQSYYLVFRASALSHPAFREFWDYVPGSRDREAAIRCECSLALYLCGRGLKAGAYLPADVMINPRLNPSHAYWDLCLEKWRMGFVKRDLLRSNKRGWDLSGLEAKLNALGYDARLITDYLERIRRSTS